MTRMQAFLAVAVMLVSAGCITAPTSKMVPLSEAPVGVVARGGVVLASEPHVYTLDGTELLRRGPYMGLFATTDGWAAAVEPDLSGGIWDVCVQFHDGSELCGDSDEARYFVDLDGGTWLMAPINHATGLARVQTTSGFEIIEVEWPEGTSGILYDDGVLTVDVDGTWYTDLQGRSRLAEGFQDAVLVGSDAPTLVTVEGAWRFTGSGWQEVVDLHGFEVLAGAAVDGDTLYVVGSHEDGWVLLEQPI